MPEEPVHDFNVASEIGCGQSKFISEYILDKGAEISGVRSACCRVGIIAGPIEKNVGLWNKYEYIPSSPKTIISGFKGSLYETTVISSMKIIVSSPSLGVFPGTFPSRDRIDWLPVDSLSKILV